MTKTWNSHSVKGVTCFSTFLHVSSVLEDLSFFSKRYYRRTTHARSTAFLQCLPTPLFSLNTHATSMAATEHKTWRGMSLGNVSLSLVGGA